MEHLCIFVRIPSENSFIVNKITNYFSSSAGLQEVLAIIIAFITEEYVMHDQSTYTETKSTAGKVDGWFQITGVIVAVVLAVTMVVALLWPYLQK